ncbi:excinuclease ABC subunit UvrA [Tenggerimyces flavus]|uniref:UvrABC system protein A n=1 Tax=Tenggerimyces flavus TaxID=1708749 RepID=A0ABV7YN27_9ACTN|nr:ATP-binding cassette domain-containing protein [Tenggerimyces flavus]MBM7789570.1 excinuclease ABC subunit A [Tenggerimyces flavus]
MSDLAIVIRGAAENTLRDVDVSFGRGVTAVVGVSGSGKSSLVFDTLFHEARRRFLETLSLSSPWSHLRPALVRAIDGLGPAVAVAQNVVNHNPNSTVATATGIHPFLRVLYASFAVRTCPRCGAEPGFVASGREQQLSWLRHFAGTSDNGFEVVVPLVRKAEGSHQRLLELLVEEFGAEAVEVDGNVWRRQRSKALRADVPHDIMLNLASVTPATGADELRRILDTGRELGSSQLVLRRPNGEAHQLSRIPLCPACGDRLPTLRPTDFRTGDVRGFRLGGLTLQEYLELSVSEAMAALSGFEVPSAAARPLEDVRVRLAALAAVELGYLPLDRTTPTLSRGEAQRLRLAVLLATPVEDLLHVLDEPTIGLSAEQVERLLRQFGRLRGPVVMVEHDRWAVAQADQVVELGPGGGRNGGAVTFRGSPAELWQSDTVTGQWFSGRATAPAPPRPAFGDDLGLLTVRGASANNLRGFDCAIPVGRLTVVTGPSGAGKSTFARNVVVGSLEAGEARGCTQLEGPGLRAITVDQSPIGRNPRSNPATYTGLASHVRNRFAKSTGLPASAFSFNRSDGACPTCSGMGAVELELPHLPSEWLTCETCDGQRFGRDVLEARIPLADGKHYAIAELYDSTIERAFELLSDDKKSAQILTHLIDIGLGYLTLGQPSPTLSGGEAQRVKLTKWLTRVRARDLILLDEPTTGLHPADLSRLTDILHRLVHRGCTVLVVEHHPDIVEVADWVIRLGPGGGPEGGRLLGAGTAGSVRQPVKQPRPRERPRRRPRSSPAISVVDATANNLDHVTVTFPKNAITAIVGRSGSGKSSLLTDVLAAEASRRLLECLSMYERQSVKEGPEAAVASVEGLGPTVTIEPDRNLWNPRRTVGTATDVSFHVGVLLAYAGTGGDGTFLPNHFSPQSYRAACLTCGGMGTVPEPRPERLIVNPAAPLCKGAMYSPGFFPHTYMSKPENGGYWMIQGLGQRYGFDPFETPWEQMTESARQAFLFGEPGAKGSIPDKSRWVGFFPVVDGWDQGGLYLDHLICPACEGGRLRPEFLAVRLAGANRHDLHRWPLVRVADVLDAVRIPGNTPSWVATSRTVVLRRLRFLAGVGLGYLHLDRGSATLSAGEAQRIKLASLLGADLSGMTVLLDEPTRGLHPREVDGLADSLCRLRDAGNTIVLVDHDPVLVSRADQTVVLGPAAGRDGGRVLQPASENARALVPTRRPTERTSPRRTPTGWMTVRSPSENNLTGADIGIALGVFAGICGVSGSGKSTLGIDIIARALAPSVLTTSVAMERVQPGAHDGIVGAPTRTVYSDQSRSGIQSPGQHLGVLAALRRAYAATVDAAELELTEKDLTPRCDACHGRGFIKQDMGFLPSITSPCDVCEATGYHYEARRLVVRGHSLPALESRTLAEVLELWLDVTGVARPLEVACSLGLGYLRLGQPSHSLSGGEAQRLKLTRELRKKNSKPTLFILDEPTVGLHPRDVASLRTALEELVDTGHSVLVIEHEPSLLAACDWLLELGPGAGPEGGQVVATGTPEQLAKAHTPTAPYLAEVLP